LTGWTGFRGLNRDATVDWLPDSLPDAPVPEWVFDFSGEGLGGIAASDRHVIWGGRDQFDTSDVFVCADAKSGREIWRLAYPASPPPGTEARDGRLDYGNSPRGTPLIAGDRVVTIGAFGDVHCLELETGNRIWSLNYLVDFEAKLPTWGFSGSPLLVGDHLILQPGGKVASLVAVRLSDGESVWETPGDLAGYASPIRATGKWQNQVIVSDSDSFGGWDSDTGQQLWDVKPHFGGEFLVPSPVLAGGRILFIGEANGARLHEWAADGKLIETPVATNDTLTPDTHTPIVVGDQIVVCQGSLYVLDSKTLQESALYDGLNFGNHVSLISDGRERVLVFSDTGALHLFRVTDGQIQLAATARLTDDKVDRYSHPALVGDRFYVRLGTKIACFNLR
jgi:outer membrane protein assembly factor BamB